MNGISFANSTGRNLFLVIEPIGEEYEFLDGDRVEIDGPLYIDDRNVVDVVFDKEVVTVFVQEDARVRRNGKVISPESG